MDYTNFISKIFDDHFTTLYRYFFYRTYSKEESEDLTSDVFFAFVKKYKNEIGKYDNPEAYLYGTARRVFNNYLRQKYKIKTVSLDDLPEVIDDQHVNPSSRNINEIMMNRISKLILQLPEKQQVVLRLRLIEKKSLQEISKILGKNMNYVKTTQKRGIRSLKVMLACTPLTI